MQQEEVEKHTDTDEGPTGTTQRERAKWKELCKDKWMEYNLCKHCVGAQMITIEVLGPSRSPPGVWKVERLNASFWRRKSDPGNKKLPGENHCVYTLRKTLEKHLVNRIKRKKKSNWTSKSKNKEALEETLNKGNCWKNIENEGTPITRIENVQRRLHMP